MASLAHSIGARYLARAISMQQQIDCGFKRRASVNIVLHAAQRSATRLVGSDVAPQPIERKRAVEISRACVLTNSLSKLRSYARAHDTDDASHARAR